MCIGYNPPKTNSKPFAVGRVSGRPLIAKHSGLGRPVKQRRFRTLTEVEAFVGQLEKKCPCQVHAGAFYIDGPEPIER